MSDGAMDSVEAREPVADSARFAADTVFGDWRVMAFIGRGGYGEVYCAEHAALGTPAAVKVLVRDEPRARARFEREARTLAALKSSAFPRFYAYGEANGTRYCAMELLEPGDLPKGDKAVADFMLAICAAVGELHAHGLVHRDIKPGNILWRTGGPHARAVAEPVLADFGFVKDAARPPGSAAALPHDDAATLAGTPGYGAPEQMERGEATEASDIHSLGGLADRCLCGNPPRAWARIIARATSSIPARRYSSVAELANAIRRRHRARNATTAGLAALVTLLFSAGVFALWFGRDREAWAWRSMCKRGDVVSVEKVYEPLPDTDNRHNRWRVMLVTNVVEGTLVNLSNDTVTFAKPIRLEPGEYRIAGPGRLDADVTGPTNVVVRLRNCIFNNMTTEKYPRNGIHYILEGGAYLNFARLKRGDPANRNIRDAGVHGNHWQFSGPLTREELAEKLRSDREREFRMEVDEINRENRAQDRFRIY